MPTIAEEVTHVYTRQHHQTSLLPSFEGPFRVAERTSRSVWKIEVGTYKDGRKRYEFRHRYHFRLLLFRQHKVNKLLAASTIAEPYRVIVTQPRPSPTEYRLP